MKNSIKFVALLAVALLLPGYSMQAYSEDDSPEDVATAVAYTCKTYYKGVDPAGCSKREYAAKAALDNITDIPQGVADKCTTDAVADSGYAGTLKCIQDGEAAIALSEYIGALQEHIHAISTLTDQYTAKIREDAEEDDSDQGGKDGAELTEKFKEIRGKISALSYPATLGERQSAQLAAVSNAANRLVDAIVVMSEDLAYSARGGQGGQMEKDAKVAEAANLKYKNTAKAAYKSFGVAAKAIDADSLTLKD